MHIFHPKNPQVHSIQVIKTAPAVIVTLFNRLMFA